jgi:type I restriction enzyme M protein
LRRIGPRSGLRLDPKYRWLWDYQHGIAIGDEDTAVPLSTILRLVELQLVQKGDLDEERRLVDLESVESRQAIVSDEAPLVSEIGSNKVRFEGAEMVISKLEPYLGKIIITPDPQWIGTTEWIGLERVQDMPLNALAYFLMLPELCEAYRRLQSGKRHARFVPTEFFDLRVSLPQGEEWQELEARVLGGRAEIISLRERTHTVRAEIDQCFGAYLRQRQRP